MRGIKDKIEYIQPLTGDHGNKINIENSNIFAVRYGAGHYVGMSDNQKTRYLGGDRTIRGIYKYKYNNEFFICIETSGLERIKQKDNRTLHEDMNISKNYHIIHPNSFSVESVDVLPKHIGGDTLGGVVFSSSPDGSPFSYNNDNNNIITIFDTNNRLFTEDIEQLEPASEDDMVEFEEADKIKDFLDIKKDDGFVSSLIRSIKGDSSINKDDVFESVPNKDLRKAHNDNTTDQYLEKVFNSSPLDRQDIMTIIPGIGNSINTSRPNIDLRNEHLEFMKSDEYRKILKSSKYIMESNGETADDVEKLKEISDGLKKIDSASSYESSELDIRDVQTLNELVVEIRNARESLNESSTKTREKHNSDNISENEFI